MNHIYKNLYNYLQQTTIIMTTLNVKWLEQQAKMINDNQASMKVLMQFKRNLMEKIKENNYLMVDTILISMSKDDINKIVEENGIDKDYKDNIKASCSIVFIYLYNAVTT